MRPAGGRTFQAEGRANPKSLCSEHRGGAEAVSAAEAGSPSQGVGAAVGSLGFTYFLVKGNHWRVFKQKGADTVWLLFKRHSI